MASRPDGTTNTPKRAATENGRGTGGTGFRQTLMATFRPRPRTPHGTAQLIIEQAPRSPASEAYRTLRTNLQFRSLDKPFRTLVVTSATAGEGKTTTVANFGAVVAQAGIRVCLIDSDLRRPNLHRVFGRDNTRGLTTALVEDLPPSAVAQSTHIPNLSVVTTGPLPPNPAELAGSKRMRRFLETGVREFDLLLCDTPPVLAVADGLAVAAQCDGIILVVAAGAAPADVVRRAREHIIAVKGEIVGVLLNRVDFQRDGYYYASYYRYEGDRESAGERPPTKASG